MKKLALFGLGLVLIGAGCSSAPEVTEVVAEETQEVTETSMDFVQLSTEEITGKQIRISTDKGDIVMELYPETAPMAVSNMINLAQQGFYDGVVFHRREEGFVIQGGDPEGTGRGGPGYTFADELNDEYTYERGVLAMANRGPDTNGSQFFIMLDDTGLPKAYTIFGRVTEGLDIVDAIVVGDVMNAVTVEDIAGEVVAE